MRDLIVTAIVFGSLPWILSRPYIGIYVWYWLGLMNAPRACYGFAYTFPFAQVVVLTTLSSILFNKDKRPVPWDMGLILFVLLYLHTAITSATAWIPDAAWSKWLDFGKIILVTVVMTTVIYGRERIRILMLVCTLSVGFFGFKGGIFAILTGGSHRIWGPPGDTFISGNNEIGLALVMVIPLIIGLAREEKQKWIQWSLYIVAFFSAIATIFTYSRGALLGLCVVLFLTFTKTNKKYIFVPLLISLAFFGKSLLPEKLVHRADTIGNYEKDISAMQRIRAWQVAFRIAIESPILGAGFDFESAETSARWFSYTDPEDALWLGTGIQVAHSIYFQVLGQHGFAGLGLFMGILIFSLAKARNLYRNTKPCPEYRWIGNYAAAIQVGVLGYMVSGAFLNKAWFDLIWLYVGLLAVLGREMNALRVPVSPVVEEKAKINSFVRPVKGLSDLERDMPQR